MPEVDVEIRPDAPLTTTGSHTANPEDAYELHDWPGTLPDTDETVTVAIMDSGIHEELVSDHDWFGGVEVAERYDAAGPDNGLDQVGHGSGVASIVSKNATQLASVFGEDAPPIEFYDVRIFGDSGRTGWNVIEDAYRWLIDHGDEIDLVNMSWGATNNVREINQLHEKLLNEGVHDVVAAGNTGTDGGSPATSKRAFSAGAVDESGDPARFSSFDPGRGNPDVAALGVDCKMARAPGTDMGVPISTEYTKASGTSFAAPYTTAAYSIALYTERASWDERFMATAPDIPGTEKDGGGLLQLDAALEADPPEEGAERYSAATWDISGDVLWYDADVLPKNMSTEVEVLEDTDDYTDLRVLK